MPLLILVLVVGVLSGLFASRNVAVVLTSAVAVFAIIAFVRAATDGIGTDPWWIVPVVIVTSSVAIAAAWGLSTRRQVKRVA
jgi:hypothetical protein